MPTEEMKEIMEKDGGTRFFIAGPDGQFEPVQKIDGAQISLSEGEEGMCDADAALLSPPEPSEIRIELPEGVGEALASALGIPPDALDAHMSGGYAREIVKLQNEALVLFLLEHNAEAPFRVTMTAIRRMLRERDIDAVALGGALMLGGKVPENARMRRLRSIVLSGAKERTRRKAAKGYLFEYVKRVDRWKQARLGC